MIKRVKAEGTSYLYVVDPYNESFDGYEIVNKHHYLFKKEQNYDVDDLRLYIEEMPFVNNIKYAFAYLFWLTPKNLNNLDKKVMNDTYTDDDFEDAVKVFNSNDICRNCKKVWEVLSIDPAMPYFGNRNLERIKFFKIKEKNKFLKCPDCGGEFYEKGVLKVLRFRHDLDMDDNK